MIHSSLTGLRYHKCPCMFAVSHYIHDPTLRLPLNQHSFSDSMELSDKARGQCRGGKLSHRGRGGTVKSSAWKLISGFLAAPILCSQRRGRVLGLVCVDGCCKSSSAVAREWIRGYPFLATGKEALAKKSLSGFPLTTFATEITKAWRSPLH